MPKFSLISFCLVLLANNCRSEFKSANDDLVRGASEGVLAAFGDFDADKLIDIFVIGHHGQTVDVLLQRQDAPFERHSLINSTGRPGTFISSLMLADFNGDVVMDILLTTSPISGLKNAPVNVDVYLGQPSLLSVVKTGYIVNETLRDQPLLFDLNADQLPDLLAETEAGHRYAWIASRNKTFVKQEFSSSTGNPTPLKVPGSHTFVDINMDSTADLVLCSETSYEEWIDVNGIFKTNSSYELPPDVKYVGQSVFVDLNQDGEIDHIVPTCRGIDDNQCTGSEIYIRINGKWQVMKSNFSYSGTVWEYVLPNTGPLSSQTNYTQPVTLVVGDYNIDGYPDILVVLTGLLPDPDNEGKQKQYQRAFLLDNIPCSSCEYFSRTFDVIVSDPFDRMDNIVMAAFYDIYEDGILDVILVYLSEKTSHLHFLRNQLSADAYFLKVLVVSGICESGDCNEPYGANIIGPNAFYKTTKTDGSIQISQGTQLTQSAHFPLQLPYVLFGLGPTSNFIEAIKIGIPRPPGTDEALEHQWPQIIPNSQIIIIPNPLNDPDKWSAKLYVTPSQLVYLTGFALLGTCAFLAIIVGILHWREKREDLLEKKQEAQKFHFDAM